jgi:DNA polymerase-3 subunit epsilon
VAHARIIDVAVLKLHPTDRPHSFNARLNPGVPIPPEATEVHGIRNHHVQAKPPFARIAPYLTGLLRDCDLAGYNLVNFDLPVLAREFGRTGRAFSVAGRAVIDVFAIFKKMEPRDLAAAVKLYVGREHKLAHRAAAGVLREEVAQLAALLLLVVRLQGGPRGARARKGAFGHGGTPGEGCAGYSTASRSRRHAILAAASTPPSS